METRELIQNWPSWNVGSWLSLDLRERVGNSSSLLYMLVLSLISYRHEYFQIFKEAVFFFNFSIF